MLYSFKIGDKEIYSNTMYQFMEKLYANRDSIHFIHSCLYRKNTTFFIKIHDNLYSLNRIKLKPNDFKSLSWNNYWNDIMKQQDKTLTNKTFKRNWVHTIEHKIDQRSLIPVDIQTLPFDKFIKYFMYYSLFYLYKL